jgi:cystathionine beta-lyase
VLFGGWTYKEAALFIDTLKLFGIGASWGGFESLAILADPAHYREAAPWQEKGTLVRLHVGLEDPADLIADLEAGFAAVSAARP